MDNIIPMNSVRLSAGSYEVLGTSHNVVIERASGPNGTRTNEWHLFIDGEYAQTYGSKREALQACQSDPTL